MDFRVITSQPLAVLAIWLVLLAEFCASLWERQWPLAFVALATFVLTLLPRVVVGWFSIRLPTSFLVGITVFIFCTIFLGEAFDFYNRYWWWDAALHFGSALGFGLIGFLLVFMMFDGDSHRAPALSVAFFGFCFAMTIGALWEVFEFAMDQLFGMNMQKSGLRDTMGDLIVDALGAFIGAAAGYLYLRGGRGRGLTGAISAFVGQNRRYFRRNRR